MRKEFRDDIKCTYALALSPWQTPYKESGDLTPYGAQHKLDARVPIPLYADDDSSLAYQDTADVVDDGDGGNLGTVD